MLVSRVGVRVALNAPRWLGFPGTGCCSTCVAALVRGVVFIVARIVRHMAAESEQRS